MPYNLILLKTLNASLTPPPGGLNLAQYQRVLREVCATLGLPRFTSAVRGPDSPRTQSCAASQAHNTALHRPNWLR